MNKSTSTSIKRQRLSEGYEGHLRMSKRCKVTSSPPAVLSEMKVSEKVHFWESIGVPQSEDNDTDKLLQQDEKTLECNMGVALVLGMKDLLVHLLFA